MSKHRFFRNTIYHTNNTVGVHRVRLEIKKNTNAENIWYYYVGVVITFLRRLLRKIIYALKTFFAFFAEIPTRTRAPHIRFVLVILSLTRAPLLTGMRAIQFEARFPKYVIRHTGCTRAYVYRFFHSFRRAGDAQLRIVANVFDQIGKRPSKR